MVKASMVPLAYLIQTTLLREEVEPILPSVVTCLQGSQRIVGHCGHRMASDTQKIDIVLAKRVCVIQNTEHYIIMLLVSVCRYDLACQRLLSGIIACTTFRRLRILVPHQIQVFLDSTWTVHIKGGVYSFPILLLLLLFSILNLSIQYFHPSLFL